MGFTDDCYTDGRDPSVTPSVLLLLTDFIAVTDGISLSVKLDNVVVSSMLHGTPYNTCPLASLTSHGSPNINSSNSS
jgi:hypothetical protein